eukprot:CAMPEP_0115839816 /NCGR_PEP_ID=MMETSP0287-20121206/6450_1 /TAXON_ID=412157 /ORGANISM="Chrysochromulina rotalis, Strain UIO044" /LENGTH=128 /DNA_ID=CAMNT_0003293407 /DNA_START=301 /DNA_END=684 /DNA_ORIENTATION=-
MKYGWQMRKITANQASCVRVLVQRSESSSADDGEGREMDLERLASSPSAHGDLSGKVPLLLEVPRCRGKVGVRTGSTPTGHDPFRSTAPALDGDTASGARFRKRRDNAERIGTIQRKRRRGRQSGAAV